MRKSLVLAVILSTLAVSAWAIGEARLTGRVVDADGKPIADVQITVSSATAAKNITESYKSDKNGKFTIFLLDGTIPYKFSFKKEGFAPFEDTAKLKLLPERNEMNVTLLPPAAAAAASGQVVVDPAVEAYNEGAELANQGKMAEAIVKMEAAVAAKPDLTVGHMSLAKLYSRTDAWEKAITAANAALAISPDEPDMFAILAQAYEKTGNKEKAKEFKSKAPANPPELYNDAAKLINAGNDKEAEPLLRRAVDADPSFAQAQYELGMVYVRLGNVAGAKEHLQKYLELEPNGKDAPVAKEMLKYVQ
ncbi:MAG TPA: tetratricopeptide repeat protein [Thermoanaerobaculia bacterium]